MIEFSDRDHTVIVHPKNIMSFYLKPQRIMPRWEIQDREQSGLPIEPPTFDLDIDMARGDSLVLHYTNAEDRQRDYDLVLNTLRTP